MDSAIFHSVFLFIVWLQAVEAHVEPPANVTLHCHNLHNVLKWSYGQHSPGLKFRVDIGSTADLKGYPNMIWISPPAQLQADVSFLSDPTNDYFLTVTAVIGQNESDYAPYDGINFSYFKDSPADRKCFVDFPSVNVTAQQDSTVLLRFTHPWLVYHQRLSSTPNTKPRKKKSHDAQISQELPVFHYDVVVIGQKERHHNLDCVESVCEEKLSVDPTQKKHCVKVKGELQKIAVRATQEYCVLPFEESQSYLIYYCIVGSLLALSAVAIVLFMVYRKMTSPSSSLPNSMTFTRKLKQWTFGAVQENVFVPEVGPTSPTTLLTTEEDELTPVVTPSAEPDLRLPLGMSTKDEGVSVDVEEGHDEGPGYKQGGNLDEDDALYSSDVPSGYEKRAVVVELAPDELAEGYRG